MASQQRLASPPARLARREGCAPPATVESEFFSLKKAGMKAEDINVISVNFLSLLSFTNISV
jgi:hypothetical protein